MIRNLLATTAVAVLLAGGAYAQDTTAPASPAPATEAPAEAPVTRADGHLASNIIGETVYNGTSDDAENIGKVNDVVIGADGKVEAVVVGVGGFLGLGEKNVAVNYGEVEWAEQNGDRWLVVNTTKEQLQAQADFDRRAYDPAPADVSTDGTAPATDSTAMAPADDTTTAPSDGTTAVAPAAPAPDASAEAPATPTPDSTAEAPATEPAPDSTAQAPAATDDTTTAAIDKSQLTEVPAGEISSEELVGTTVYGADDANIGEIGDVLMSQDGKVDSIILDVGGFLGVGEKKVAVGMDNLSFMTDKDGNKYLYTTFTKEQLDAQPAYDESTYAEKRDEQRLMMQ
ncbi:PRC-barrel domain containing protein [Pseudaminobacter arsenicus]|uniref:PRC-barrel domain containing protein n=1 Tax=Borborobacter arsenicus TaxID=1851146 RepID=A0A432V6B0_9HYPH|nr:PRC-barrel domain-containing protein [Pseudaminobacter arsenicus]RUM97678.1 PRC-barrel domain containing protein [Pseudaminobacter arsenicus]